MRSARSGFMCTLALLCLFACANTSVTAWAQTSVSYPVEYNVNPHEGTVEFWLRYPESRNGIRPFFLRGQAGRMNFRAGFHEGEPTTQVRFKPRDHMYPVGAAGGPGTRLELDENGWVHVAFVWEGADVSYLYINGERRGSRAHSFTFSELLGELLSEDRAEHPGLFFSAQGQRGWTIDEFRLSTLAREPAELGFHGPLEPDVHTAILDRFETIVEDEHGQRFTVPEVLLHGRGGKLSEASVVEGWCGRGLALDAHAGD